MSNELQKAAENASFQMWQAYCDKKMECEDLQEQVEAQAERIAELEAQVKQLQRVPLSEEDICNLYCQSDSVMHTTTTNLTLFARAIEAAHKISAWSPMIGYPKDGSDFYVTGGVWQTDDQSHGMTLDYAVRVRYQKRINDVDSPFVTDDGHAIKNPEFWSMEKIDV